MMAYLTRPAMAYGGRIGFAAGTPINQEIKNLILKYRVENKFGSEKIVEILKNNHGITLNQSTVGRELTRLKNAGVPGVDIPRSELAAAAEQRIYQPGERKIYKVVREITPNDRVQNPNIPKNAKYKVQLPSGAAKGSSLVTEYFNTEKQAQNAITNVETRFVEQVAKRAKPFNDAIKDIHKIALASPDEINNVKNLAKLVYGSASDANVKNIANDLVRYQEFLLGFKEVPGLNVPGADKLDDILSEFPAQNQWGKFASEEIRRSKLRIRDQILKTKGPKLATIRNNILKAIDTGVFNLDEAMGLSATFENAPGYTELGQVIKAKVNTIKGRDIDGPFSQLFKKVIAGTADPKDITAFNKKSKAFQIKHGVDTPIIEYKPGQKLDASKFVKHFDKLSPEAQKNVKELASKGIALRSKAKPMSALSELASRTGAGVDPVLLAKAGYEEAVKPIAKVAGKAAGPVLKTVASPLGAAGFAGWTIADNLREGKSLPDSVVDKWVGVEMLFPEVARQASARAGSLKGMEKLGGVADKILKLGRVGRMFTPVGAALTTAGLAKDYYRWAKDEIARLEKMEPDERKAYNEMMMDETAMYEQGGRVGFAKGSPKSPGRRAFLKGITALAALPIVGRFFKLSDIAKRATTYSGPTIEKIKGMPEWFPSLVKKLWNEGEDVTKTASWKERQVVRRGTLEGGDDVDMIYDLDTGNVSIEVNPPINPKTGYRGSETTSGAYNKEYGLDYTKGQADEMTKGTPPDEFSVGELEPRQVSPEDVELDGTMTTVDDAFSDLTELEAFAKNKTTKQIHKKKGTKPKDVFPHWEPPDYDPY